MTTGTGSGEPGKLTAGMTLFARQPHMAAGQREVGAVVIEGGVFPIRGLMAGRTIGAEFAAVFIVLAMAGVTIRRGALIDIVEVTFLAADFGVLTFQFEGGEIMVEGRGRPTVNAVTGGAI